MRKYLWLMVGLLCHSVLASVPEPNNPTNTMLSVRMQWSTNSGLSWNEDEAPFDDSDRFPICGLSSNCFCYSQVTNWWGSYDIYEPVTLQHYWGDNLEAMTNQLNYSTFYVVPNRTAFPNIIYRPLLSITNYYFPPAFNCTNCTSGTNGPPPPPP